MVICYRLEFLRAQKLSLLYTQPIEIPDLPVGEIDEYEVNYYREVTEGTEEVQGPSLEWLEDYSNQKLHPQNRIDDIYLNLKVFFDTHQSQKHQKFLYHSQEMVVELQELYKRVRRLHKNELIVPLVAHKLSEVPIYELERLWVYLLPVHEFKLEEGINEENHIHIEDSQEAVDVPFLFNLRSVKQDVVRYKDSEERGLDYFRDLSENEDVEFEKQRVLELVL